MVGDAVVSAGAATVGVDTNIQRVINENEKQDIAGVGAGFGPVVS